MMKLNLIKLTRWSTDSRPLVRSIDDKNNDEKYQREEERCGKKGYLNTYSMVSFQWDHRNLLSCFVMVHTDRSS